MNPLALHLIASAPGGAYFLGMFHVVRMADATRFASLCSLSVDFPVFAFLVHDHVDAMLALANSAIYGLAWWWHRNDDDDDHRGKRLRAWTKSKLPKPATRTVRSPA